MTRALLLPLLALAACTTGPDRPALLNSLVGQSETEVVRVLGVPSRTYETAGHKFLAYTEQRATVVDGGPAFFGGYGGFGYGAFGPGFGWGYGSAFPAQVIPRICETTFDVAGGRVLGWSLRGNACG